jgi:hypothetical protein
MNVQVVRFLKRACLQDNVLILPDANLRTAPQATLDVICDFVVSNSMPHASIRNLYSIVVVAGHTAYEHDGAR